VVSIMLSDEIIASSGLEPLRVHPLRVWLFRNRRAVQTRARVFSGRPSEIFPLSFRIVRFFCGPSKYILIHAPRVIAEPGAASSLE
jgi:hypothetical protein